MSSSAAALKLFDLIQSHRVTAVIYVAALRIFSARATALT